MAKLTEAEKLKRCRMRVSTAKKYREKEGYDELWKRLNDLYRGKHFAEMKSEDQIAVNIAFSTINVIFPAISVNNPKITVLAREPEKEAQAVIAEAMVNYWWSHYKVKPQFRLAAKDFLMFGFGYVKVGWKLVEVEEQLSDEEYSANLKSAVEERDTAYEDPNVDPSNLPVDADIMSTLPSTKLVIREDRPFVERVSPKDIFVDPEATTLEDAKFIAQRIRRPLAEVKKDKRYDAAARNSVGSDSVVNKGWWDDRYKEREYGDDVKRVTVWEYYDLRNNTMEVFAESGDKFLVKPRKSPFAFGHPFVMLRNYDVPDMFYPMGDLEAIESLNLELDQTRSQMMNHRKRYARKYLFHERAFSIDGRAALESDDDMGMVPVIDENRPLTEVLLPIPVEQVPADFYQQSEIIEADVDRVSGVNEYARGAPADIRRTATEASIIQDAANARAADKLAVIEDAIGRIGERLVQLAQQFLTGDQIARVMGKNGQGIWIPFDDEDIQGEFDFTVEGGSTRPHNEEQNKQTAMEMLQVLAPFAMPSQAGPPILDAHELIAHVLRDGFGVKNPEKFFAQEGAAQVDPNTGQPLGQPGPSPDQYGLVGGQPTPPGAEAPPPEGGIEGVPPEVLAQLQGQIGYQPA